MDFRNDDEILSIAKMDSLGCKSIKAGPSHILHAEMSYIYSPGHHFFDILVRHDVGLNSFYSHGFPRR